MQWHELIQMRLILLDVCTFTISVDGDCQHPRNNPVLSCSFKIFIYFLFCLTIIFLDFFNLLKPFMFQMFNISRDFHVFIFYYHLSRLSPWLCLLGAAVIFEFLCLWVVFYATCFPLFFSFPFFPFSFLLSFLLCCSLVCLQFSQFFQFLRFFSFDHINV